MRCVSQDKSASRILDQWQVSIFGFLMKEKSDVNACVHLNGNGAFGNLSSSYQGLIQGFYCSEPYRTVLQPYIYLDITQGS